MKKKWIWIGAGVLLVILAAGLAVVIPKHNIITCVPGGVIAEHFPTSSIELTENSIPVPTANYALNERYAVGDISVKIPWDTLPARLTHTGGLAAGGQNEPRMFVFEGDAIETLMDIISDPKCVEIHEEFLVWSKGKSDLELLTAIIAQTPDKRLDVSNDLSTILFAIKGALLSKGDSASIARINGRTFISLTNQDVSKYYVFEASGKESAFMTFTSMTREQETYVLYSIQKSQ